MKLSSETIMTIAAPAEFVREYVLDVSNWQEFVAYAPAAVRALFRTTGCTWEGTPWMQGGVLVMRGAVVGIGTTARARVTAPESGEMCRFVQEAGLPGMKTRTTFTYSVDAVDGERCRLTYRTYVDGPGTRFVPTIRRELDQGSGLCQMIKGAWTSSGPAYVARAASPDSVATPGRTCRSCDSGLPDLGRFCPRCGTQVIDWRPLALGDSAS